MKDEEILLYDLGSRPASFDFVTCLSTAIAHGAKHVRFVLGRWKPKNYTNPQERWESIVEPASALFGIDYSIGERKGTEYSHFLHKTIAAYRQFGMIGKIQVPIRATDYVTITLRKSRNPERDSKETEWQKFAEYLRGNGQKVLMLRDYDEQPLDLHDRMTLYAGAKMNFMVINGPLTLCIHSDAPYLCMRTIGCEKSGSTSPEHMAKLGITPGFQFPWANENQRLSYLTDDAENIAAEYVSMQHVLRRAA